MARLSKREEGGNIDASHPHKTHPLTWILALLFVVTVAVFAAAQFWLNRIPTSSPTKYGITFSHLYAQHLGLDPKTTFQALVENLGVRAVRLPVYWSDVERTQGSFDWSFYDWVVSYAQSHDVAITMAVGVKVPRWPECYVPDWAEGLDIETENKYARSFIKSTIERYRSSSAIERWQVENEPLFPFGECRHGTSLEELEGRVAVVRSLDTRPIQMTVSGELGLWGDIAPLTDILGISMYRRTWNELFGYFVYPISPEFYQVRAQLVLDDVDQVIVSELQAEPWFVEPFQTYSTEEAYALFTKEHFESNLSFVQRSGFSEAYFWGAEWWYYMKEKGDDRLWNVAGEVF